MKRVRLLCWGVPDNYDGDRNTATTVIELEQISPLTESIAAIARDIDTFGELSPFLSLFKCDKHSIKDRITPGHGITILYPSGRKRTVHGIL